MAFEFFPAQQSISDADEKQLTLIYLGVFHVCE